MQRLGPLGKTGQDLQTTDHDLDREQDRRADRQTDDRRVLALRPPGDDGDGDDDGTDDRGDPAMQDVGGHRVGERREQRPAHERPVRVDEGGVGRGHVRPEQQERERRGARRTRQAG